MQLKRAAAVLGKSEHAQPWKETVTLAGGSVTDMDISGNHFVSR